MDPDKALEEIRHLCREAFECSDSSESVCVLATAFEILDDWLRQGGFLPASWLMGGEWDR